MRTVTLTTANQECSKLIKAIERGEGFLITRRGRPIARLVPHAGQRMADSVWASAYRQMMERLEDGSRLGGLRVDREELFDR